MRGLFNFFFVLLASLLSWKVWGVENCTLRFTLDDNGGDGWNHNYVTVQSNNQDVTLVDADGVHSLTATLNYGLQTLYTLSVAHGSVVSVLYHSSGKYPAENLWQIQYDQAESPILHQGVGASSDFVGNFVVQCCCTPAQPTGLEIWVNQDAPYAATFTWDAVDGAISYLVSRQVNDGKFAPFGEYTQTSIPLTLSSATTYRFTVTAVSSFARSPVSEAVSVSTTAFDSCEINLLQFDNLDDATARNSAYLSVSVGDGVALYQPFNQKSVTTPLQLAVAAGEVSITSTIVSSRDTSELEFEYALGDTEFYHQGGSRVVTSNSFTLSCADVANSSDHLLSTEKQHLLAQHAPFEASIAMHAPPTNSSRREELQAYCQYALIMADSRGNGWNGMWLSIFLSGTQWASPLYVPGNSNTYTWYFWLNEGTPVQIRFTNNGDSSPLDGSYLVREWDGQNLGATVVSSGGGGTPMGNTSWTACSGATASPSTTTPPPASSTTTTTTTRTPSSTTQRPTTTPAPTPAPATCPSRNTCAALFRNNCAATFNPPTCGTCLSGYQANDGSTNSPSNSPCALIPTCPTNCSSLNRNACRSTFNPLTCGTCLTGFAASDGSSNSNSNAQCNDVDECGTNTDSCDSNAACTNTQGSYTCACNAGFTGNGFTCTRQQGCGQRIRREWFSLSAQQRDQYVRAVNQLYSNGQYAQFADYHSTYASTSHGTAAFLPWHRIFLQWFEDTVRGLGGEYTCFTLPYWDWTNSQNTPSMFTNAVTSAGYRTGLGTKDGRCFGTGHPFQGFSYRGTCVSRSAYTTPSNLPSPATVANQIQSNFYSTIRPIIESYHNSLHVWVGNTMNQVPTSPSDPIFFVHHAFVDQIWATWQTCRGYANLVTQPSNINIVYESGNSWTAALRGWSQSAQDAWNLIGTFNVRYERTWFSQAFAGLSSATCPVANQQFLAAYASEEPSVKHLLSSASLYINTNASSVKSGKKKYRKTSNAFRPNKIYLAQQQAIYETFKDTYLETQNVTVALDKAFVHSCLLGPTLTAESAQLFTPDFIVMMDFQEECDAGLCVNPCWTRLFNSSY